jgi:uncharacterized protein YegL
MTGIPIAELNAGLKQFHREVWEAKEIRDGFDVGIVSFSDRVRIIRPLTPLTSSLAPALEANGDTPFGEALTVSRKLLEERWAMPVAGEAAHFKPWLVVMSDGQPTDEWEMPAKIVRSFALVQRLVVLAVGIGDAVDMDVLSKVTVPELPPIHLRDLRFSNFFTWLRKSLALSSGSRRGERLVLPPPGDWKRDDGLERKTDGRPY